MKPALTLGLLTFILRLLFNHRLQTRKNYATIQYPDCKGGGGGSIE